MQGPSLLVDLRVAQIHRERGIPRYSQSLVLALANKRPELEITCLIDPDREPPLLLEDLARQAKIIEDVAAIATVSQPITHFLQGGLFEGRKPIRSLFPRELAPYRPRLAAMVYDLIPWLFPDPYLSDLGFARDYRRIVPALSRLDRVFAISESVRRDVIAISGAEPSRVVSIYGGLDEGRWPMAQGSAEVRSGLLAHLAIRNELGEAFEVRLPFWLYVGGDDFRKNLPRLVDALSLIKGDDRLNAPLVVACSMGRQSRTALLAQAEALNLRPGIDIVFTGYVSDSTLGQLFANCMATVFPSLYEGLGLPVLESYLFEKPVLASDTSSFRELVPAKCRFDPYSSSSIAESMRQFLDDPEVAEESMAFAPQAIELGRWSTAVGKLGGWLDIVDDGQRATASAVPLWIASSLPPEKSGVAVFTQRSFAAPARPVAFFAPVGGAAAIDAARDSLAMARHALQHEAATVDVLSLATLADARLARPGQPVLFVLGNSKHHSETLAYLLEHGADPGDAVHLHDVFLGGLLALHFGTEDRLGAALLTCYPPQVVADSLAGGGRDREGGEVVFGPRLLVRQGGVRHFIVNSAAAADRLQTDLDCLVDKVRIDSLFHPVFPTRVGASDRDTRVMRIGHFGILEYHKQPDRLVAACDILETRQPIELVLAGYEVERYLQGHGLNRSYITVVESPSDKALEEIMSGVDCAVQLRFPDHGASSGVVNQLLSMQRPVVCTRIGSFLELEGAVSLVAPDVSPGDLAIAIEAAISSGWPTDGAKLVAERSPLLFETRLRGLMGLESDHLAGGGRERRSAGLHPRSA